MRLYKYSGAGNDFVVLDGRGPADVSAYRETSRIASLCDRVTGFRAADSRVGADGLMILSDSDKYDFRMEYYNADGSGGMMCGNGGRCIVAFADELGITPASPDGTFLFEAADGLHSAEVMSREGDNKTVRLQMKDVRSVEPVLDGCFLNTGTRHFVRLVDDVEALDVDREGRDIRWNPLFAPEGANVNFVDRSFRVRTFEKGVEAETLACGTGLTACAIVLDTLGITPSAEDVDGRIRYLLQARRDALSVDFIPCTDGAESVFLTGPAELIR